MPPRDSRHFVPALVTLGENPRFLFGRPRPPSARSGEDLKPTTRLPLRFVQKLSVRHVSNSLSTQRRQTIDPAPHRGRCGRTTAYGLAKRSAENFRDILVTPNRSQLLVVHDSRSLLVSSDAKMSYR